MRDVLQFHSAYGEEVSLEEIAEELVFAFASLNDEGYVFELHPQNPFESIYGVGSVQLAKFKSDYGAGRLTFAVTLNNFQEPPWVRKMFGRGPPGLGKFVFTGEVSGCGEDVEEVGASLEGLFGEYGLGYTKAGVDDAIDESRKQKIPLLRESYLGYALGLEIGKGPMGDEERLLWLREQETKAWQAVREQSALADLREIAAFMANDMARLYGLVKAWRKQN